MLCSAMAVMTAAAPSMSWCIQADDDITYVDTVNKQEVSAAENETVYPSAIALTHSLWNTSPGQNLQLSVGAVTGAQNWDKTTGIAWSSDHPEVASVSDNGRIEAKQIGEAVITASVIGTDVKATCKVVVGEYDPSEVYPTKITLNPTRLKLDEGKTSVVKTNGFSIGTTNKEVVWSSDDPSVAVVDQEGNVTAVGAGITTIRAVSVGKNEGQDFPAEGTCSVEVTGVYDGFKYTYLDDGTIKIIGCTKKDAKVEVPASINGKKVTVIGSSALARIDASSVIIPEGVTAIESKAFYYADEMTEITLPSTLRTLGQEAFYSCKKLTSVYLPYGVTSVGTSTFYDCESLSYVYLPQTITQIGSKAFHGCDALQRIDLPDRITSMTSTSFDKGVTKLYVKSGSQTADKLLDLNYEIAGEKDTYPLSFQIYGVPVNKQLDEGEELQLSINGYAGNPTNKDVIWTSSDETIATVDEDGTVTGVGEGTVEIKATSVGVADGLQKPASASCTLTVRGVEGNYIYTVEDGGVVIQSYTGEESNIVIPETIDGKPVKKLGKMSFWMNDAIESVVIPNGVEVIDQEAFSGDKKLSEVTLPDTLKSVGQRAFYGTAIKSLTLPEGVTSISREAFSNCRELTTMKLPSTLTSIGPNAFSTCSALKLLVLPDNITYLGTNALKGVAGTLVAKEGSKTAKLLESQGYEFETEVYPSVIGLNESKKQLDEGDQLQLKVTSYSGNATNHDVTWSTSNEAVAVVDENGMVTAKGEGTAVITATAIGNVPGESYPATAVCTLTVRGVEGNYIYTVEDGGVVIQSYTGEESNIVIPETIDGKPVKKLGKMSFWMNDAIESVVIPNGVEVIDQEAFSGDKKLSEVTLPDTLKSVGQRAFYGTAIKSLTLPEGVTSISREAFSNCRELTTMKLPSTLTSIGPNAFSTCSALKLLVLPDNITYLGTNALKGVAGTLYVKEGTLTEQTLKQNGYEYKYYVESTMINRAPVIEADDQTLTVDDSFDPMADVSAFDAEEGDLTDQIRIIVNTVDMTKAGTYTVAYQVIDSQGAKAVKYIKVVVKEKTDGDHKDETESSEKNEVDTSVFDHSDFWIITSFVSAFALGLSALTKRRKSE